MLKNVGNIDRVARILAACFLFFLAWGGFSDSGLEAESYDEPDGSDTPR